MCRHVCLQSLLQTRASLCTHVNMHVSVVKFRCLPQSLSTLSVEMWFSQSGAHWSSGYSESSRNLPVSSLSSTGIQVCTTIVSFTIISSEIDETGSPSVIQLDLELRMYTKHKANLLPFFPGATLKTCSTISGLVFLLIFWGYMKVHLWVCAHMGVCVLV